jgi:hypothetical protein
MMRITEYIRTEELTRTTRVPRNGNTVKGPKRTVSLMTYPSDQVKSDQGIPVVTAELAQTLY